MYKFCFWCRYRWLQDKRKMIFWLEWKRLCPYQLFVYFLFVSLIQIIFAELFLSITLFSSKIIARSTHQLLHKTGAGPAILMYCHSHPKALTLVALKMYGNIFFLKQTQYPINDVVQNIDELATMFSEHFCNISGMDIAFNVSEMCLY